MARVLVVDDDPDLLNLVTFQLVKAGHSVLSAPGPEEALEIVADRGTPDVAVLDVSMPQMDGYELLAALRSRATSHLPAVFLTARVQEHDYQRGAAMGARYLTKPYVRSALLQAISDELAGDGGW